MKRADDAAPLRCQNEAGPANVYNRQISHGGVRALGAWI